jgi:hypothetical protein
MSTDEMREALVAYLATFRTWSYSQLSQRVERDVRTHECLDHFEGVASDGTPYQIESQAYWDDKRGGDVRVVANLSADPQKPILGFIYRADASDSFIMAPNGQFVGE